MIVIGIVIGIGIGIGIGIVSRGGVGFLGVQMLQSVNAHMQYPSDYDRWRKDEKAEFKDRRYGTHRAPPPH